MPVNMTHAREAEQRRRMQDALDRGLCPFCAERFETIHGLSVEYFSYWMSTDNAFPYEGVTVHKMFVYRRSHITRMDQLPSEAWAELGEILSRLSKNLNGCSVYIRSGAADMTGSSVEHLHINLIQGNASGSESEETRESLKVKLGYKTKTPVA